jgi:hypothetical protein
MTVNKHLLTVTVLLVFQPLSGSARAAYDPAVAGADSQWVIYADMNALRASALGKELVAQADKAQAGANGLSVHIDVQKLLATVGTVTAYGSNFDKSPDRVNGTLVVKGTADMRKIVQGLLDGFTLTSPDNVSELKTLPFEAYAISGGAKSAAAGSPDDAGKRVVIAFPPEGVILVSKSEAQLLKARDVLRGQSPSLAQNSSSPLTGLIGDSEGAFLLAAAVIPSGDRVLQGSGPNTRLLQMARSGSLAVGETGDRTFAHLRLVSNSPEMADKLGRIVDGMTAMMSLAESSDHSLNEFLKSAAVSRNGNTVTLNLAYSSARLVEMIRSVEQSQRGGSRATAARDVALAVRVNGKPVATWPVASTPDNSEGGKPGWAWFTMDRVHLANGASVILTGSRNGGNDAQFDRVEVVPAGDSGATLVFRPQHMRLVGYRMVDAEGEGSGKRIEARGQIASAQFDFPGSDGDYKVRVHYLADPRGKATFTLSIKDSDPAAEDAPAHDNSGAPETR